jgi:hypothetical protein
LDFPAAQWIEPLTAGTRRLPPPLDERDLDSREGRVARGTAVSRAIVARKRGSGSRAGEHYFRRKVRETIEA